MLKYPYDYIKPPIYLKFNANPNPSNPLCSIKFKLKKNQKVKINIYDLGLNENQLLNNKNLQEGEQRLLWDA